MQDYYETLQVHPKADAETIQAAYERLRGRYDASKLDGVADELQVLARGRRDEIERAYTILGDPQRRASYDAELALYAPLPAAVPPQGATAKSDDELIDYRPLPPAGRHERAEDFNAQPMLAARQAQGAGQSRSAGRSSPSTMPPWLPPALIVAVATFAIVLVTLVTTVINPSKPPATQSGPQMIDPNAPTVAPTTSIVQIADQFEAQIVAAKQVANDVPKNPQAWVELGNVLYDSVVVIHERLRSGDPAVQSLYVQRLPRWLEASEAYRKALALEPTNVLARADLAATLCYYGEGANDQSYVQQGLTSAEQALRDKPDEGRALLSAGLCAALATPPQTAKALEHWQRLVVLPGADPALVFQARQLIQQYGK